MNNRMECFSAWIPEKQGLDWQFYGAPIETWDGSSKCIGYVPCVKLEDGTSVPFCGFGGYIPVFNDQHLAKESAKAITKNIVGTVYKRGGTYNADPSKMHGQAIVDSSAMPVQMQESKNSLYLWIKYHGLKLPEGITMVQIGKYGSDYALVAELEGYSQKITLTTKEINKQRAEEIIAEISEQLITQLLLQI